jgi:excisionase family DNA binding protein
VSGFDAMLVELVRTIVREELDARTNATTASAQLLSVAGYAKKFSLGNSTVRRAIAEGRLTCVRIGRSVRLACDAVIVDRAETALDRAEAKLGLRGGGR